MKAGAAARARRRFLRAAFASLAGTALAACDRWSDSATFTGVLRSAQFLSRRTQRLLTGQSMAQEFTEADITQPFRSNGTDLPDSRRYRRLAEGGFADWGLEVGGLVQAPLRLTLAQLQAMPSRTQITRHDCVEGWSAIAKWTGVPLGEVLARAGPLPAARYIIFHYTNPINISTDMG